MFARSRGRGELKKGAILRISLMVSNQSMTGFVLKDVAVVRHRTPIPMPRCG